MQLIYDLAFTLCVLLGYDPCDGVTKQPEWRCAATRFCEAERIDGWASTHWWLDEAATYRPSAVRAVWIDAATLPHVESLRPFAFHGNGAWGEVQWAVGAKEYVRDMSLLYPRLERECDERLTWLEHYREAFYCLYLTRSETTLSMYEQRWHLDKLRRLIGDDAFRDGVMPGRVQP